MTKYLGHNKIPDSITIEPVKIKMSVISNYLNSLLYLPKSPLNRAILNPTLTYYEFSSINDEDKIQPVTKVIIIIRANLFIHSNKFLFLIRTIFEFSNPSFFNLAENFYSFSTSLKNIFQEIFNFFYPTQKKL